MKKLNQNKQNKQKIRQISFNLILNIFILLTLTSLTQGLPQIQLISQTDPLEYGEIQTITLNITSNTSNASITQALIEFNGENHTLQKEDPYHTYSWIPTQKGTKTYKIYATDSLDETQSYTTSFEVQDTTPPEITETQPQGILDYNLVELKAITNENCTCKYDEVDVSYDSMYFSLSGQGLIHTTLRSLSNGEHTFYVRCKDPDNNIGQSQSISFTIDTLPPIISGINPTGTVNQEEVTLRLNTGELATCKWDINNEEYHSLDNDFQTTGATIHEQPLYLTEGINTYYLSCRDQIGNHNPTLTLNIELNLPPTASLSIDKNDSYQAITYGTYELSLSTSEPLSQTPTLKLAYSNKIINIPLEGSSTSWEGYLMIPQNAGEHIGEFSFVGIDGKGTRGNEITSGKLIIIDTSPPTQPENLRLHNENNKIRVSWEYEGEDIDHFNIYRSTTGNTDKSNQKATSQEITYEDADITNRIGYFYRISAVDKAGNEGDLSEEEFIMAELQNITTQFQQDPELLEIINTKINQIERIVQGIDVKITELEETTDQDQLQIINEQELVNKLKQTKNNVQTLIGELKTYRETSITKDELQTKIEIIDTKLDGYKKGIIKKVKIKNKIQNEQILEENMMQEAIKEYLENKALTEYQQNKYYTQTRALQQEVRILQELISYEIEYQYQESQEITLIKETLLSSKDLNRMLVQEIIPKEVLKITDINFTTPPHDINRLGVLWLLKDLENSEASYYALNEKPLNQLQEIRTMLLYDVDEFLSKLSEEGTNATEQISGEVVAEENQGFSVTKFILIPLGVLMIVALLIYYFFFLKTEAFNGKGTATELGGQEQKRVDDIEIFGGKNFGGIESDYDGKERKTIISESKQDLNMLLVFIQHAYEGLEQGNIDAAYENYSLALSCFSQASLSLKDRLRANFEMNTLREKIIESI